MHDRQRDTTGIICSVVATVGATAMRYQYWVQHKTGPPDILPVRRCKQFHFVICVIIVFSIVTDVFISRKIKILMSSHSVYFFIRIIALSVFPPRSFLLCSHALACLFVYSICASSFRGKSISCILLLVLKKQQLQGTGGRHV
jgi:hypothetical protein